MAADKSPAFQFYPKDFLSSDAVSLMTSEQVGAYMLLLCHSWLRPEGLPSDLASLAKLSRVRTPRFISKIWPQLVSCFNVNENGFYYNARLERARTEQEAHRLNRSESGRKGNVTRWGGNQTAIAERSLSDTIAIAEPIAKHRSSSSSASSVRTATSPLPPAVPLHGRRNPDLMTYGPIPLWASQFRDEILPLAAAFYKGERDVADAAVRGWIREMDAANADGSVVITAEDVKAPKRWWKERAVEQWSGSAISASEVCPRCGSPEGLCVDVKMCNRRWLDNQKTLSPVPAETA